MNIQISSKIRQLLGNNKMNDAFSLIKQYANKADADTFILLESNWKQNEKQYTGGVLSFENYNITRNKILKGLLDMLPETSGSEAMEPTKNNNMNNNMNTLYKKYKELKEETQFDDYSTGFKNTLKSIVDNLKDYLTSTIENEMYDASGLQKQHLQQQIEMFERTFRIEVENKEKTKVAALKEIISECAANPSYENARTLADQLWIYNPNYDYRDRVEDAMTRYGQIGISRMLKDMNTTISRLWDRF